jgi:hypothetical protein
MRFSGERREAEFVGQVQAEQRTQDAGDPTAAPGTPAAEPTWGRSFAVCHRMEVTFDKPVYFNQLRPADRQKPAGKKDENPKVETVVCSPAPEDGEAGRPRVAARVYFAEEKFSARTGKHVKAHRIEARLLELRAEAGRTLVTASGPGETRTLQPESKDPADSPRVAPAPDGSPARTALKPGDEGMNLTVVRFAGKLRIKDQKGIFQQAVYEEAVRVFHIPGENLNERVEEHAAPPRSVVLRCTDTMTVSAYKGKDGGEGTRTMEAVGGAKVQDDAYVGDGHTITYDGTMLVLRGYGDGQATLRRRERTTDPQDFKNGREIRYDTKTGRVTAVDSSGGQFSNTK